MRQRYSFSSLLSILSLLANQACFSRLRPGASYLGSSRVYLAGCGRARATKAAREVWLDHVTSYGACQLTGAATVLRPVGRAALLRYFGSRQSGPEEKKMKRSSRRVLTTHTGSLPRPADLIEIMRARETGQPYDEAALKERVQSAVVEVVHQQAQAG